MMRMVMSAAATGLMRNLIARSGVSRDRILLTEWISTDWQSLTFVGERHEASLRICGPDASSAIDSLLAHLEDVEFNIPGHIVADIQILVEPRPGADGSRVIRVEALTIEND